MAIDLVPRRFLSFPSLLPSIWDEDEDWLNMPSTQTGLSVSEDEKYVYVEAAVPGVNPDNIEVTYQDGYVWIKGEQQQEEKDKKRKYYRKATNAFSYRVAIPVEVDLNKEPEATYEHGMMKIAFMKSEANKPKKIAIKQKKQLDTGK
jgi:HSP20 family protein